MKHDRARVDAFLSPVTSWAAAPWILCSAVLVVLATQARAQEGVVRVASLVYADGQTGICFSSGFLETVRRETDIDVVGEFVAVELASDVLFDYPFAIMTGEGGFTLSDEELGNLGQYLERGGFLLASAGCSNGAWADSFRQVLDRLGFAERVEAVTLEHPLFHTLYDIDRVDLRKPAEGGAAMLGVDVDGRLALLFSPLGLNATDEAGDGCCCCGGNEIRNASLINANALVYALTH